MCTIHSTNSILKEGKELGIVENGRRGRVICLGKTDIIGIEWWARKRNQNLAEIPVEYEYIEYCDVRLSYLVIVSLER